MLMIGLGCLFQQVGDFLVQSPASVLDRRFFVTQRLPSGFRTRFLANEQLDTLLKLNNLSNEFFALVAKSVSF
jgi:hypothetical protein